MEKSSQIQIHVSVIISIFKVAGGLNQMNKGEAFEFIRTIQVSEI